LSQKQRNKKSWGIYGTTKFVTVMLFDFIVCLVTRLYAGSFILKVAALPVYL